MMFLRPTQSQLARLALDMLPDERLEIEAATGQPLRANVYAEALMRAPGIAHVFLDDEGPYAAGGVQFLRRGLGQTWMISTGRWWTHVVTITRVSRALIRAAHELGYHRVQCLASELRPKALQWYRTIGLHQECTMDRYGVDGERFYLFCSLGTD